MWFFLSSYSFFDRFCFFRFDSISLLSNTLFSVSGRKKEYEERKNHMMYQLNVQSGYERRH